MTLSVPSLLLAALLGGRAHEPCNAVIESAGVRPGTVERVEEPIGDTNQRHCRGQSVRSDKGPGGP